MSFIIRQGDEKDVSGIMKLVRELALFERAPEAVVNTEKMLLTDGFGKHSLYKVVVAEAVDTNDVIGMALYYTAYSTWKGKMFFLDDLVVTESYRNFGIGRKLINEFLKAAKYEEVNEIRWQVLNWNTPAIEFYKSLNVNFEPEWITVKMNKEQIEKYLATVGSSSK
jgi:ribosomal protein S18 acetylase RimI-like enzyme